MTLNSVQGVFRVPEQASSQVRRGVQAKCSGCSGVFRGQSRGIYMRVIFSVGLEIFGAIALDSNLTLNTLNSRAYTYPDLGKHCSGWGDLTLNRP